MKKLPIQTILIFILSGGLLVLLFLNFDKNEVNRDLIKQKERERVRLKHREDSLRSVINRKDEQILKAFRDIREAEILRDIANEQAADYKRKYENIKIRTHSTDLERADALKRLYPN